MLTLTAIVSAIVGVLAVEAALHRRARRRVPIRIHVNGIRGKSSVVRLIAAGLRQDGIRTWAKVTGTLPAIVDQAGEDIPVFRGTTSSIIEQRAVIAEAAKASARALVVECMALEPAFQRAELGLLQPTLSVITNVRLDHEEVFGASILDIALALTNTIPRGGQLFTTVGEAAPVLTDACARKRASATVVETEGLPDSLVQGFSYIEHKENVALALAVCEQVGVPRETALAGMRACKGDPGALRVITLSRGGKTIEFVSALAANDPQSTMIIFQLTVMDRSLPQPLIVLVNTRRDRPLRSLQLGRLLAQLPAQRYLLLGDDAASVMTEAARSGVSADSMVRLRSETAEQVVDALFDAAPLRATVFAIGNTAERGLEVANYFVEKGWAGTGEVASADRGEA